MYVNTARSRVNLEY